MSLLPYTILSSAASIDGFLNDTHEERLLLSHPDDFARVDALRATCDGILVGAHTLRLDNPSLVIRSQELVNQRLEANKPKNPARITLSSSGNLPPDHSFFAESDNDILVYCPSKRLGELQYLLNTSQAEVVSLDSEDVDLRALLVDLKSRGINRLLIEGGQHIATAFLQSGLINELQLAVAPFFVGQPAAPRFVGPGAFPHNKNNRMHLASTERVGDMAVLTYKLETPDNESHA